MAKRTTTASIAVICLGLFAACGGSEVRTATRTTEPAPVTTPAPAVVRSAAPTTAPILAPTVGPPPTPTAVALPSPTPTATPVPRLSRTLLFSGDVLSHTPVIARALANGGSGEWAYDYRPMFADVAARIGAADLAICVLETPVSEDNLGLSGYPTFLAPRELPDALVDAGYDGCSTASNHSMDRGPAGVRTTLDQMDRAGLAHAGMARSQAEWESPRIYDVDGVAVAHLSWTYGLNGFVLPDDEPWLVDVNDVESILAEARRARAAGAEVVVLSIQWGNEYQRSPSTQQLALAEELTADGELDLIIGNHAHVVQPVDTVNGVPVVYGLGNSLSNQYDHSGRRGTQDGVMIQATIGGNHALGYEVESLAFAPTWVDRSTYTIIDLGVALDDPSLDPGLRSIYQASYDRTAEAVNLLGAGVPVDR